MKGMKTGGRKRGTPNRITDAQKDLLAAWDKECGPETARAHMRAAKEEAIGKVVTIGQKDGSTKTMTVRDFEPLRTILPYFARKMPETVELHPSEAMSPDEVDSAWGKRQDKPKPKT